MLDSSQRPRLPQFPLPCLGLIMSGSLCYPGISQPGPPFPDSSKLWEEETGSGESYPKDVFCLLEYLSKGVPRSELVHPPSTQARGCPMVAWPSGGTIRDGEFVTPSLLSSFQIPGRLDISQLVKASFPGKHPERELKRQGSVGPPKHS